MQTKEVPIVTYMTHAYCDCGGELFPNGTMLMSDPPQYEHVCNKCGKMERSEIKYPALSYKELPREQEQGND